MTFSESEFRGKFQDADFQRTAQGRAQLSRARQLQLAEIDSLRLQLNRLRARVTQLDTEGVEAVGDHTALTNIGTNTHAQIDTHIATSSMHFTEASIDHTAIQNVGSNSHSAIDTHIADAGKHREINDAGSAATDLWSASKIGTDLAGKSSTGHSHTLSDVTDSGALAALGTVSSSEIDDEAVTNAKLAHMTQATIKGRASGAGTGDATDLTAGQARTVLNVADGANAYSHPNHTGDVTSTGDGATVIADDAVTTAKILDENVTTAKIADSAVNGDKIASGVVSSTHIASSAVSGTKIATSAVSLAKMANLAAESVIGNITVSSATPAAVGLSALLGALDGVRLVGFGSSLGGTNTAMATGGADVWLPAEDAASNGISIATYTGDTYWSFDDVGRYMLVYNSAINNAGTTTQWGISQFIGYYRTSSAGSWSVNTGRFYAYIPDDGQVTINGCTFAFLVDVDTAGGEQRLRVFGPSTNSSGNVLGSSTWAAFKLGE